MGEKLNFQIEFATTVANPKTNTVYHHSPPPADLDAIFIDDTTPSKPPQTKDLTKPWGARSAPFIKELPKQCIHLYEKSTISITVVKSFI